MLTPTRLLLGLAALCSLSLLTLLLSLDSNLALAYVSIAGYSIGGVGLCLLVCFNEVYDLPPVLRLPTLRLPRLHFPKGSRIVLLGLAAVGTFFFLPPLVRLVYPTFGGFAPDTINAYTLGAAQYFLALTMAYAGWRLLFPSLYRYAAETMEGKLLESITADLLALFAPPAYWPADCDYTPDAHRLAYLAERRKLATLQFLTRCARFIFCFLPFFILFCAGNAALTAALTAVPAAVPGL